MLNFIFFVCWKSIPFSQRVECIKCTYPLKVEHHKVANMVGLRQYQLQTLNIIRPGFGQGRVRNRGLHDQLVLWNHISKGYMDDFWNVIRFFLWPRPEKMIVCTCKMQMISFSSLLVPNFPFEVAVTVSLFALQP